MNSLQERKPQRNRLRQAVIGVSSITAFIWSASFALSLNPEAETIQSSVIVKYCLLMRISNSSNITKLSSCVCSDDVYDKKAGVIAVDQLIDLRVRLPVHIWFKRPKILWSDCLSQLPMSIQGAPSLNSQARNANAGQYFKCQKVKCWYQQKCSQVVRAAH